MALRYDAEALAAKFQPVPVLVRGGIASLNLTMLYQPALMTNYKTDHTCAASQRNGRELTAAPYQAQIFKS